MIKEHYPLTSILHGRAFLFNSKGTNGIITKAIIFEDLGNDRFNLAFGDLNEGRIDDEVISNNHDPVKVIATVAKAVYLFTDDRPGAVIEIEGVDERRRWLYNLVFKRHIEDIRQYFLITGMLNGKMQLYDKNKIYSKFEIVRKKP